MMVTGRQKLLTFLFMVFLGTILIYKARGFGPEKMKETDCNNEDILSEAIDQVSYARILLDPPASSGYNFTKISGTGEGQDSLLMGQYGQLGKVVDLFNGKKKGFFIEAGALDGERLSNTLVFELRHQWTGLLVEANPFIYLQLLEKKRKVHSVNVCLSTQKSPMNVKFEVMEGPGISGMLDKDGNSARSLGNSKFKNAPVATVVDVLCLPLFTLLAAMDFPTVDFFSLDVEGAELGILQTIPWHQVDIRVVLIEFSHLDKKALLDMMTGFGYDNPFDLREDMVFVKKEL